MANCTLSATLLNQDGTPRPGVRVSVYVLPTPGVAVLERETLHVSEPALLDDGETANPDAGKVSFDIVRGTKIRISILGGVSRELTVPDASTANFLTLMGAVPDPFAPVTP